MISLPFLLLAGPCLILAMGALALAVVNVGLSRAHHALYWAAASALGALRWALAASQGDSLSGHPTVQLLIHLAAITANLLVVYGLLIRRHGRLPDRTIFIVGAAAVAAVFVADLAPGGPFGADVLPAVGAGLLLWAVALVVNTSSPPSPTESIVVATFVALAMINIVAATLALGTRFGLIASPQAYATVTLVAAEPASAALVLGLLMLIAYDYSVELRRLLHTDPLTGVLNREGFLHAARVALERGRNRRLAVAIADIDRFKQVNDVHGHAVGDAALTGVAGSLAARLGRDGVLARIGGEEFAILLPGLDARGAFARVEALRHDLEEAAFEGDVPLRLTASFGVAERLAGEDLDSLMERADEALYRSKRGGRNRASLAEAEPA